MMAVAPGFSPSFSPKAKPRSTRTSTARLLHRQRPVGDGIGGTEGQHAGSGLRLDPEAPPPEKMADGDLDGEHDEDDRGQMDDEGVEGEAGCRADQDVRRIADQGRRAADIGAQHLAEEEGEGRQLAAHW